jgi:D-alanyl-D-alanine dipeptidase
VAEQLAAAAKVLRAQHRRIVRWDCYRPASVQRTPWMHRRIRAASPIQDRLVHTASASARWSPAYEV